MSYQLFETDQTATDDILCPHCQHAVINWSKEQYIQPCEHVMFIAIDLGFEYIADVFEQTMGRSVDEIHAHDDHLDIFTELTSATYPNYIIYKIDLGVQNLTRYVGFSFYKE